MLIYFNDIQVVQLFQDDNIFYKIQSDFIICNRLFMHFFKRFLFFRYNAKGFKHLAIRAWPNEFTNPVVIIIVPPISFDEIIILNIVQFFLTANF